MSHNTLRTPANFLLDLHTSQSTLILATLRQEANIHLSKAITMGSQHLVPSSHQLALRYHHTSTLELQCKDQVTKVVYNNRSSDVTTIGAGRAVAPPHFEWK